MFPPIAIKMVTYVCLISRNLIFWQARRFKPRQEVPLKHFSGVYRFPGFIRENQVMFIHGKAGFHFFHMVSPPRARLSGSIWFCPQGPIFCFPKSPNWQRM